MQGVVALDTEARRVTVRPGTVMERLNAQLRTTCVATLISGGHAENALPQRAKATVQCRMLPGDSSDNVRTLKLTL